MKTNALLLAALALAACSPDFDPASKIDKLRVLAVKAGDPEIKPAGATAIPPDATTLTALVVRADFATPRKTTVVYLSCLPRPGSAEPTPCVLLATLDDPTAYLAAAAGLSCAAPPGGGAPVAYEAVAGVEECKGDGSDCTSVQLGGVPIAPVLALPAGWSFAGATPAEEILGVQADVLAFAIDADWETDIVPWATGACPLASAAARFSALWSSRERDHVLSLKRVRIRGPKAPNEPNENPAFGGIAADNTALGNGATLAAADVDLLPTGIDPLLVQDYTELDAAGMPIRETKEDWVYAWFSTAGEMEHLHTRLPDPERWKLGAADAGANGRRALVAAVVRDLRGGVAWQVREVALQP